jgi:hypothetical protein
MANCCDMNEGDVYFCDACGLELEVKKTCTYMAVVLSHCRAAAKRWA